MKQRVTIAGIGAIGGFGHGWQALARALREPALPAESVTVEGVSYPAYLSDLESVAAELGVTGLRRVDRFARLAILSSMLAMVDAGMPELRRERVGVIVCTGYGAHESTYRFVESARRFGDAMASPLLFSNAGYSGVLAHVTINLKLCGPGLVVFEPCLAFTAGLIAARQWLAEDRADAVILIGQEECRPVLQSGFHRAYGECAKGPVAPFAFARHSAVMAEGSACFLLTGAALASPNAVCVDDVAWLAPGERAAVGHDEIAVLAADGMVCCGRHYHAAVANLPAIAPAPVYGSMPTGIALAMAAAAALLREGGNVHANYWNPRAATEERRLKARACLIECAKTGESGAIHVSRA